MEQFDFCWGGVAPKYSNHENCSLELHHGGVLESGEYKNGKVCYLDNFVEDFLSLVDLRKVGKGLGYNVDISNPKPNLEIWYRKGGTHGVGGLELISSDAKLVDMLDQMPCNRIVVLYYTEVGNSNIVWSQASFGCQGLDGADNYAEVQHNVQVEDETEVQDKSQVEYETGVQDKSQVEVQDKSQVEDETGVQDKIQVEDNVDVEDKDEAEVVDSEEDDEEFVDSDYEFSEEEFGFKIVEVPVHEGAEDTMNGSNEGPAFEALEEVLSDGEHTSDFDTESEGDGVDMERDNEGTSKVRRKKKLPRFKQYRREVDLKNPEFQLGMQFENRQVLKEALREYSIIHGRKLFFEKNDKTRVKAICNGGFKCPFVVYASQINQDVQTFAIKKLSLEHTCGRVEKLKFANPKCYFEGYFAYSM